MIYKYRMLSESNDDFLREYEIKSSSRFLDFHLLIQDTVKFLGNELASFYICDSQWNPITQITLLDMVDEDPEKDLEGYDAQEILVMHKSLLMDFMEEPRQRLIYEYDFLKPKTFYIELKGIVKEEAGVSYPRCTFSVADPEPPKPIDDDEDDILEVLEDIEISEIDQLLDDMGGAMPEDSDPEETY